LGFFSENIIWVNSNDLEIIEFAKNMGVKTLKRPDNLSTDLTPTVDVLKFHIDYFKGQGIVCDAIILLQPTNPFRDNNLLKKSLKIFKESGRNSLATFSLSEKKIGEIASEYFKPINYTPGQRAQDLEKSYFENGLLYITKCNSILEGKIITDDVYPLICYAPESKVDIDYLEDFIFAEVLLKLK